MIKDLVLPSPPDVPAQVDLLLRQLVSAKTKNVISYLVTAIRTVYMIWY